MPPAVRTPRRHLTFPMNFSEYKFDPTWLADQLDKAKAGYAQSGRAAPWADYVAGYVFTRMKREPHRYVEYGPYWWAVKAVLAETGRYLGDETDAIVLAEYGPRAADGGLSVELSLLAGELFKAVYADTFMVGTRTFALKDDGSLWKLEDADMEAAIGL